MLDGKPETPAIVNKSTVSPAAVTLFGHGHADVPHSTPLAISASPPSDVTVPPSVAVVSVTRSKVGKVTVGATTDTNGRVVNESSAE